MLYPRSLEPITMRRRSGFTLVEVLVAMALILFIMTILAAAFGSATQAVGDFKAAGDLAERLRGASTVLKRDLQGDHTTDDASNGPRMSSATFWDRLNPASPPPAGFFRIFQARPDSLEGSDLDNIPSFYQVGTALHYTIALRGIRRGDFLSAFITGSPPNPPSPLLSAADPLLGPPDQRYQDTTNVYSSQFAEACLFLAPTGDLTDPTPGPPQPLFALCRRQFLTAPKGWTPPPANTPLASEALNYLEVSTRPSAPEVGAGNLAFNTVADLSMPVKRFWMDRGNLSGTYFGGGQYAVMGQSNPLFQASDLLMTDVVSFDVRVLVQGGTEFEDLFQLTDPNRKNPQGAQWFFPFNNTGFGNARVYDTWTNQKDPTQPAYDYSNWQTAGTLASVPIFKDNNNVPIAIKAIQITLRVWDFKTKKTRQTTIVQQM